MLQVTRTDKPINTLIANSNRFRVIELDRFEIRSFLLDFRCLFLNKCKRDDVGMECPESMIPFLANVQYIVFLTTLNVIQTKSAMMIKIKKS